MEIGIIVNDDSKSYSHMLYGDNLLESSLPTLIVGWENVKTLFGDKVSIRKNEVSDGIFWCFSRRERRSDYENSLDKFNKECIKRYCNQFSYVFLDLICDSRKKIKKIIREIYRNEGHFIISNNQMLYIYFNNIIIGIDLNQLYYIGIDNSKILSKLKGTNINFYIIPRYLR